ncbi:MAG: GNAT family N-acetyltransferase [Clostridia bacterium]|nr:GNAT family N-acetyltransferase [Clostridia bacterium]
MQVEIKEVITKKDLWKWVRFPNKLYKNTEAFVPFLESDEFKTFSKDKNPAYDFCETKLFLAYKGKKIVGRIAGLINHAYNEKWSRNSIRFTRFDFTDDFEVSKALFDAVVSWGKKKSYSEIMGPIGFTDIDHQGMLVEGFDKLNMSVTFYNSAYYAEHMEKLGLSKDIDWIEYKITLPDELDPRIEKVCERIAKKGEYTLIKYADRKMLQKDAFEAFELIDQAYSGLYGTVPLTREVIKDAVDAYIPLVNLKYICAIKDSGGKIVSFGIMVPSIAKALKKSNGKMFPFGFIRLLKALNGKNDTLEMFLVAVDPNLQSKGIPALIINELIKVSKENGIRYCETGPMLETNTAIHSMWRHFEKEQHKRRRCFLKNI